MRFAVALIAAVGLASPALATNALLGSVSHAVETFEEYNVGDIISTQGWPPSGGVGAPRPFLALHGVIEEENGNKYLELFNDSHSLEAIRQGYANLGQHNLTVGGGSDYAPGHGEVTTSKIFSIDFLSQSGGSIFGASGDWEANLIATIPAGGWNTVNLGTRTNGDFNMVIDGPGRSPFKIDNIHYSAFTNRVPEPEIWMMLIAGFGAVGATLRKRRAMQPI